MSATLLIRHPVDDFDVWYRMYKSVDALRCKHGCVLERILGHAPGDRNDVVILHEFANVGSAQEFVDDPEVKRAMVLAGVYGPARVEIFES